MVCLTKVLAQLAGGSAEHGVMLRGAFDVVLVDGPAGGTDETPG